MQYLALKIISCLIILSFVGYYAYIFIREIKNKEITLGKLIVGIIFFTISITTCVSIFFSDDYKQFGFTSTSLLLYCIVLGAVLSFVFTKPKEKKIVSIVFGSIFLSLLIFKLTFNRSIYELLPLNVCNIVGILIIVRIFYKNNFFDSYILCFGLLGCLANYFLGDWFSNKEQFFHIIDGVVKDISINVGTISLFGSGGQVFESNMVHNLYATFCIFLLMSNSVRFTSKLALKNLLWIVPLYIVLIFTNQIYKFNFLYTSEFRNPLVGIYNAIFSLTGFMIGNFKINLLYDLVVISGCAVLLFGLSTALNYFNLKFIQKENVNSKSLVG